MTKKLVVFVHGWSVRSTDTYGKLPQRLQQEADSLGLAIDVEHLWIGRYVSFRDEVRLQDIARGLEAALANEPTIQAAIAEQRRVAFITHSTGGPVVREWWRRFYLARGRPCPMSHLVMLAPANFGSALAQLGKGKVSRLKSWFQGVEPGQGVLDWLELGSPEAMDLNESWTRQEPDWLAAGRVYPFVLTGQSIDRAMYDHVNSYTDEVGSDGVVRVAAANLNSTYVKLVQEHDPEEFAKGKWGATRLVVRTRAVAPRTALAVLPGLSHSGSKMGILRSVGVADARDVHPTVAAIARCLTVRDDAAYAAVCDEFDALTARTQEAERVQRVKQLFLMERTFVNPVATQLILRVLDDTGEALHDFDFLLTSCDPAGRTERQRLPDPNKLPPGFFVDRQRNSRARGTLTYYLNHEVLRSAPALGLRILPRPAVDPDARASDFFTHYVKAELHAATDTLLPLVRPNATLLIDVVLKRLVRSGMFRLTRDLRPRDFTGEGTGDVLG
jgi:hypothetical protein